VCKLWSGPVMFAGDEELVERARRAAAEPVAEATKRIDTAQPHVRQCLTVGRLDLGRMRACHRDFLISLSLGRVTEPVADADDTFGMAYPR
jgi:hypothetical protein